MPFQSMFDSFFPSQRPIFSTSGRVWNPPADLYEDGGKTFLKMEIAGLDEQTLEVLAQQNTLTIRGRREPRAQGPQANFQLMEIHYGYFERSFTFPHPLAEEGIKATYEQGFLVVEIEPVKPAETTIAVKIMDGPAGPEKD